MSSFPLFKLSKEYLVPLFTEWLTPPEYNALYNSLGRLDRDNLHDLQARFSSKFQNFILSLKDTILANGLWTAACGEKLENSNSLKQKILYVNSKIANVANKYDTKSCERYFSLASNFEQIKVDVPFLDKHKFLLRFTSDLVNSIIKLLQLDLSGVITTMPGLYAAKMLNLRVLVIDCPNRQVLCCIIVHARRLQTLKLKGPRLTSWDLCILGFHGPSLVEYSANAGNNSDAALRTLLWYRGERLTALSLDRGSGITDLFCFDLISSCCALTSLSLALCDEISDEGLQYIFDNLPTLESMSFWHNNNTSGVSLLSYLQRCSCIKSLRFENLSASIPSTGNLWFGCVNLQSVALRDCNLTDEVLLTLLTAQRGALTSLDISRNPGLSASALTKAVTLLHNVSDLNISYCSNVSDYVVNQISLMCGELVSLDLTDCQWVSEVGVKEVLQRCSKLTTLLIEYLINCDIVQVIDCIIANRLLLKKVRVTNSTGETYVKHESRLREFRPSIDVFVRTLKATDERRRSGSLQQLKAAQTSATAAAVEMTISAVPTMEDDQQGVYEDDEDNR